MRFWRRVGSRQEGVGERERAGRKRSSEQGAGQTRAKSTAGHTIEAQQPGCSRRPSNMAQPLALSGHCAEPDLVRARSGV